MNYELNAELHEREIGGMVLFVLIEMKWNQNLLQPKINTYQKSICIWFEMTLLWYPGVNKFGDGGVFSVIQETLEGWNSIYSYVSLMKTFSFVTVESWGRAHFVKADIHWLRCVSMCPGGDLNDVHCARVSFCFSSPVKYDAKTHKYAKSQHFHLNGWMQNQLKFTIY